MNTKLTAKSIEDIRDYMRRQGITEDAELIRRLKSKTDIEIKPSTMSRIFNQERSISIHVLLGLAQVLEMEIDRRNELLRREGFGMFIQLLHSGETPEFPAFLSDERIWNALTAALRDKDSDVRWDAVETLWELDNNRATDLLVSVALHDENSSIRDKTTEILKESGSVAVELFTKALEHKAPIVRKNAIVALTKLQGMLVRDSLIHALLHSDRVVSSDAAKALRQLGDERATDILIGILRDAKAQMRPNVVEAIGWLGDKRAINPLITALQDEDEQVRANAVKALGQLGDKQIIDSLITALEDKHVQVRVNAVQELGRLGDKHAVVSLLNIIKDKDVRVRKEVFFALRKLGDLRAVDVFITALQDQDSHIRGCAIVALGELGDERAVKPLIKVLSVWYEDTTSSAFYALERLATRNIQVWGLLADYLLDKSNVGRRKLVPIFKNFDDTRTLELLIYCLRDNDLGVSEEAEKILSERGIDWRDHVSRNLWQQLRRASKKFWKEWNAGWDRDTLPGG